MIGPKVGQIGTEFTKDGLNPQHVKAGNAGKIDAKDTFEMRAQVEAGLWSSCGASGIGRCGWPGVFALERFDSALNFLIAIGDELLVVTVGCQRLFQCEDVFWTIVADETFGNRLDRGFDSIVTQLG